MVSDLFDQDNQALTGYARSLSEAFQTEAMIIGCFDSDYLYMNLLDTRSDVDIWAACGHYPGRAPRRSKYNTWKDCVTDVRAFREVMRKDRVFAEECLEEVEPILTLPAKQSLQCVDSVSGETGFIFCRYMLTGDEKYDDPPRFELFLGRPNRYRITQPNYINFLNHGGSSKGIAVFIGGEPFDTHKVEIDKVELVFRNQSGELQRMQVEMNEVEFKNGLKGFYGTCPSMRIPKAVPEGLPWKKRYDMESNRSIRMSLSLRQGSSQRGPYGEIQVSLIPLQNNDGQVGVVLPF